MMDPFWQTSTERPPVAAVEKPDNSSKVPSPPFQFIGGSASQKGLPSERSNASSRPVMRENLLKLYDMDFLGVHFDRYDPVSRQKVNKLRKSYVGKMRDKKIRFKAQAVDLYQSTFETALFMPEDQWDQMYSMKAADAIYKLQGPDSSKRIQKVVGSSAMAPGRLNDWKPWSTILCMNEDQLRTDFERKKELERERKQNAAAAAGGSASGSIPSNGHDRVVSGGKPSINNRPQINGKLPPGKTSNKRRLAESGAETPANLMIDGSDYRMRSAGHTEPGTPNSASSATFAKKKKRIISRTADGMRVEITVDR